MVLQNSETCPWQALMNVPYDRWRQHNAAVQQDLKDGKITLKIAKQRMWSFTDMLANGCDNEKQQAACVLGKLNQQVENGGFIQWVDNGYASESWDLLSEILPQMGPASKEVLELCNEIMAYVDDGEGSFREVENDEEWQEICDVSDRLSDQFYELRDRWHPEVYALLAVNPAEKCATPV